MPQLKAHYAWIKVVDANKAAGLNLNGGPARVRDALNIPSCPIVWVGNVPPHAAFLPKGGVVPKGVCKDGASPDSRPIYRAPWEMYGNWEIDNEFGGLIGVSQTFEVLNFIGTQEDAKAWISSDLGRQWRADATNYFLLSFQPPINGTKTDGMADEAEVSERLAKARSAASDECVFPDKDWRHDFREYLNPDVHPLTYLSKNCLQGLHLADPPPCSEECKRVWELRNELDQPRAAQIANEAVGIRIFGQVQAVLGNFDPADKPYTAQLLSALFADLCPPIFQLKDRYKRCRPAKCCKGIDPLFKPGDLREPAHPSYPAGHATLAHSLALVYSELMPTKKDDFTRAAERIAINRVYAGLHYPKDNEAGEALAAHLVAKLLENEKFKALLRSVGLEWGVDWNG